MQYTTEIPIEIEVGGEYKEFLITFSASIENDSIGHYEFHGQSCFDRKPDYLGVLEDWDDYNLDATGEEKNLIQDYIESNHDRIIEAMNDKWGEMA